jgi:hypothetical protein
MIAQRAVNGNSNAIKAIRESLCMRNLKGAIVSIDAQKEVTAHHRQRHRLSARPQRQSDKACTRTRRCSSLTRL